MVTTMKRMLMLCLLTALLHSAAYAAKPNAKNPAKGKPAVEAAKIDKTNTDRKGSDDDGEEKAPPERTQEPNQDRWSSRGHDRPGAVLIAAVPARRQGRH
jgi:opacity protein-like surface antigen